MYVSSALIPLLLKLTTSAFQNMHTFPDTSSLLLIFLLVSLLARCTRAFPISAPAQVNDETGSIERRGLLDGVVGKATDEFKKQAKAAFYPIAWACFAILGPVILLWTVITPCAFVGVRFWIKGKYRKMAAAEKANVTQAGKA
jgi:hypothetical protein